jgi:hypothetical protein
MQSTQSVPSVTPIQQLTTAEAAQSKPERFQPLSELLKTQPVNPETPDRGAAKEKAEKFRPQIVLPGPGRELNEFADELGRSLPKGSFYAYNDDVVEIPKVRDGLESPIKAMDQVRFRTRMQDYVSVGTNKQVEVEVRKGGKPTGKTITVNEWVSSTMNETDAKAVLASDSLRRSLPKLDRVIDFPLPILRNGKIVVPSPGYNEDLRTYLQPTAPKIEHNVTIERAKDILLNDVLSGFQFKNDNGQSLCHAIAHILTPYFRGVMGLDALVPFFNFRANRPRAGKDYLAQVAHRIYTGESFEDAALPEYDPKGYEKSEETRKRITSMFHEGRRFVHFANCAGYVEDKYFIQAITAPVWSDRILGKTRMMSWRNEMMFSISGNMDLWLKSDIEPRSRAITLEYFDENENSRTFRIPDLHGWIVENRSLVLSAIHAVFRHWCEAGRPAGKTPFTSFSKWAKAIGGVMTCPGIEFGDPCLPHDNELRHEDPELAAFAALFSHCHQVDVNNGDTNGSWWTLQQVYNEIETHWDKVEEFDYFKSRYSEKDDNNKRALNRRSAGKLLRKWKDRTTGAIRMEIDTRDPKTERHKILFKSV